MTMMSMTRMRVVLACATLLAVGACAENEPSNALNFSTSGDAVAANRIRHIIDPWPKSSFSQSQQTDGARVGAAMERYRAGLPVAVPGASPTSSSSRTN